MCRSGKSISRRSWTPSSASLCVARCVCCAVPTTVMQEARSYITTVDSFPAGTHAWRPSTHGTRTGTCGAGQAVVQIVEDTSSSEQHAIKFFLSTGVTFCVDCVV